jgi:hypothetical protein
MLHATKSFRPISIRCKISRDQLLICDHFLFKSAQSTWSVAFDCLYFKRKWLQNVDRATFSPEWKSALMVCKNSYYVKIRKLKIFTGMSNVFMSDCSSAVARDGNNKVNWSRFYDWLTIWSKQCLYLPTNLNKFSFIVAYWKCKNPWKQWITIIDWK